MSENTTLTLTEAVERLTWYEKRYGPYISKRGIHNWKNLFRWPNSYEWTILAMMILMIISTYAYQRDINVCKEFVDKSWFIYSEIQNGTRTINQMSDFKINVTRLFNDT